MKFEIYTDAGLRNGIAKQVCEVFGKVKTDNSSAYKLKNQGYDVTRITSKENIADDLITWSD